MKLKLIYDRVAVEIIEQEDERKILVPDSQKPLSNIGKVVAVGTGYYQNATLIPLTVKVGDIVVINRQLGTLQRIEGKELFLCQEMQILAIL